MGKGIRKYKEPRRNAYKIDKNYYGGLLIDVPNLLNNMIVNAYRGNKLIYENKADKFLINLLQKDIIQKQSTLIMLLKYSTILIYYQICLFISLVKNQ